ncbi:hypothetical protein Glove_103g160 [Diversispora epigaea]|uniref:Uncharacterized protein n=1 Tax=Diversispora epigaea TaxID=1348612 RepID=A0A397J843_9GLOM|nr:hypothetical protein Glove_103g160 [Diversispora epigaea]
MPRAERNRNLFASAIAGSTSSGSTTSRHTKLGTNSSEPYLVEKERATTTTRTETNSINRLIRKFELFEKKMDSLLNDNADIKKRLKNIELLTEINNDPDFSKLGTNSSEPYLVEKERATTTTRTETNSINRLIRKFELFEKKMDSLLNDNADIKKRLKNIELLTEINNDPDFSKDLVDETKHVIRKNFPDISESMDSQKNKSKIAGKTSGNEGWNRFPSQIGNF